jgi:hypothetical protein
MLLLVFQNKTRNIMKKSLLTLKKAKITCWLSVFMLFGFSKLNAQVNIAPNAVVTASTCNTGACSVLNDQNYGTCGTQLMWISTSSPPDPTPGVNWIEWNWPNPESFDEMVIHHAQNNARFLTGATMQYWDGTSWVNHHTFSNLPMQCINSITFPRLTTNRMRITSFQMTGTGQTSNPNFREIEIFSAPTSPNDAGVSMLVAPNAFCPGVEDIVVRVQNFGVNVINFVTLNWRVNGVTQPSVLVPGPIDTVGGANPFFVDVNLGPWTFAANTPYTIEAWTTLPNGMIDTNTFNDSLNRTIAAAISGTFTIDAFATTGGSNFQTFTEFADFVNNNGICGPVIANVAPGSGPYLERVVFEDIQGSSATNTITINGNGNTLAFSSTATSELATLTLNGTDYMSIDSLVIAASGASFGWTVHLTSGADHNNFTRCRFEASTTGTSTNQSNVIASGSPTSAIGLGNTTNYTTFENCEFIGGYYGLSLNGTSTTARNVGNSVLNCTFEDQHFYATYIRAQDSLNFSGNDISRATRTQAATYYGIFFTTGLGRSIVKNNIIHDVHNALPATNTSACYPVYMSSATGVAGSPSIFANNLIYNINNGGIFYGLYILGALNDHWKFYHNTVVMDQPSSTSTSATRPVFFSGAQNNFEMKNNIFYLNRPSATNFMVYMTSATNNVDFDNNVYYTPHPNSVTFGFSGGNLNEFSDWQGAGYDANGIETDPSFAVPGSDYNPTVGSIKALGTNVLSDVPFDLNGDPRTTSPDPGVYQFDPLPCTGAYDFEVDTLFPGGAEISWQSFGNVTEWQVEWDTCGFIPGSGLGNLDSVVTSNNNHALTMPMGQCFCVYIREKCPSGGYGPWTGPIEICVPIEYDAELVSLIDPGNFQCGDSLMEVRVEIRNNGFFPITSMPITAELTGDVTATLNHTYTGNLQEDEVDTVLIGTVNAYWGGYVDVLTYTALPNDQLTMNDSLQIDSLLILPFAPRVDDATLCPGEDSVTLRAFSIPGANYEWFDVSTGGTPIAFGDSLRLGAAASPVFVQYLDLEDTLHTTFMAGNGQSGNMVDFVIHNTLNIYAFDMLPSSNSTNAGFEVYYKVGSYQGAETDATAWTLLQTFTNQNVITDVPHRLTLTNPLQLTGGGTTYSFYLTRTDASVRYTSTSNEYAVYVSNNDMDILEGIGKSYPFGSTFRPRMWNGTVVYGSEACSDIRTQVDIVLGDSVFADFDWTTISHTVSFQSTSVNADSVSWDFAGLGTASGDSVSFQFPQTDSFEVCMIAYNACGTDTICQMVWAENISVERFGELLDLKLFPNPNNGTFTVSFLQHLKGDLQVEIIDLSGRVILNQLYTNHQGAFDNTYDLSHLASGMYQMRLRSPDGIAIRSFVISK